MKPTAIPLLVGSLCLCFISPAGDWLLFAQSAEQKGACPPLPQEPQGPELKEGDRVAFIGNGFFEREGKYGYIEANLTLGYADRNITFRNLGWSGDTVWCTARAYFGTPEDGFKHLLEHVDLVKPTVIILNYGGNEAFAGEAGLPDFIKGYERLLNELEKRTRRIILMSPTPLEKKQPPLPDGAAQNKNVELYTNAIAELANRRDLFFIDLYKYGKLWMEKEQYPKTVDGYSLNLSGNSLAGGTLEAFFSNRFGAIPNLTPESIESLRLAIVKKNELFFHRHRPQNETYLRGFRKHEQGNNAVEILEFEKLVEEKEKEIAKLRRELYETLKSKEGAK